MPRSRLAGHAPGNGDAHGFPGDAQRVSETALAGPWSDAEVREFEAATEPFREVDPNLWPRAPKSTQRR